MVSLQNDDPAGKRLRAVLFLVISALLWSSSGLFIKLVSWNAPAIAGSRSFISAGVLLLSLRRWPRINGSFAQIGGAVAYAGTVILFVTATRLTTAANAILLQYSAPIYVASLGAWFLGERTRGFEWAGLGVVLGGMVLFFFDRLSIGNLWGNGCAILSGVCFAGLILFMRKQKNESPVESVILGNLLTGFAGLPFMFGPVPDAATCLGILLMGVFQLGLSYVLYSEAVKHVNALEAILITAIEAVLNPVWVFLVLGERPGPWALLGGGVVLTSVTGCCVMAARKRDLPS